MKCIIDMHGMSNVERTWYPMLLGMVEGGYCEVTQVHLGVFGMITRMERI